MRSGWVEGGITDEKGGSRKRGGSGPPEPPPSGHAYDMCVNMFYVYTLWFSYHDLGSKKPTKYALSVSMTLFHDITH